MTSDIPITYGTQIQVASRVKYEIKEMKPTYKSSSIQAIHIKYDKKRLIPLKIILYTAQSYEIRQKIKPFIKEKVPRTV